MNKKELRKNLVENMEKLVRFVEREKRIRKFEELKINMVRIDEKNKTMLVQYEGISRIGNIFIDIENKCRITPFSRYCRNTDEVANSCINLAHHGEKHFIKDKNIVEFRFKK